MIYTPDRTPERLALRKAYKDALDKYQSVSALLEMAEDLELDSAIGFLKGELEKALVARQAAFKAAEDAAL
jgi:hypothetical protein